MVDVECGQSGCQTTGEENRACLPIVVPPNDPDFKRKRCIMFVRTQETPKEQCPFCKKVHVFLTSIMSGSMLIEEEICYS